MRIQGPHAKEHWPVGVIWFASYLIFLGTAYGTKNTYSSAMRAFATIFDLLYINSPFDSNRVYPPAQVNIFLALATMASYKAASTCRVAKAAAEDTWLLSGNLGPVIDQVLWKRMYRGIEVYKGRTFKEKSTVLPSQVRKKIEYMLSKGEHYTLNGASVILAELCGVLLGLRRSEHFASSESKPNLTTLLCFRNLAGATQDLADYSNPIAISQWAKKLRSDEIFKVRLCYTKHQRHRVAHEVIAGPGYKLLSLVRWIKVVVRLRTHKKERLTIDSPLLVRERKGKIVPMTGIFMSRMDKLYAPVLKWGKATIHSRRRGFATAAVRCGLHMAKISIAMRHSQGITMQYVALPLADKAAITTRLAIHAYSENLRKTKLTQFSHGGCQVARF